MNEDRLFCPLSPCLPIPLDGKLTNEIVRESRSFGAFDTYYRHIRWGHFIAESNAPLPYCLEKDFSKIPPNFPAETKGE
jgi:hypothetical protein